MSNAKTRHMAWAASYFQYHDGRWWWARISGEVFCKGYEAKRLQSHCIARFVTRTTACSGLAGGPPNPPSAKTAANRDRFPIPTNSARRQGERNGRVRSSTGAPRPAMARPTSTCVGATGTPPQQSCAACGYAGDRRRFAQELDGADADQQVLIDAFAVEVVGHAG